MQLMHNHVIQQNPSVILRDKGFRVTLGKITLLELLQKAGKPLSIQQILCIWKNNTPNQATLYRSLTRLRKAGIVRRVDLNTGVAHFEYTPNRPHHHHIVCTDCGVIEDISDCSIGLLEKKLTQKSPLFKKIDEHTLEFFGHCVNCVTN